MPTVIEVKDLVKNYNENKAVKGISFSVEQGSFFAFLGINGAGKSTTINILCTVLEKTSGSVTVGGFDLDKQKEEIRNLIGIVFQGSVLDGQLSVKENLESRAAYYGMSSKSTKKRISELSEMFNLGDIMKQRYNRLSGGQRRRVDIARALINEPRILFLDEPTTGLDPQTRKQVWSIIHDLRKKTGLTVFLTTHYMEETIDCDNVVILDSGEIVAGGTPYSLKDTYASNSLIWYTEKSDEVESIFSSEGKKFKYLGDAYKITIKNSVEATKLIAKYPQITDYEVIKGDMDDVFIAVTGKALGD